MKQPKVFFQVLGYKNYTFLIRSCVDIGVLDDHVITATLVVVAEHKPTPVLHRQTQETLNHL